MMGVVGEMAVQTGILFLGEEVAGVVSFSTGDKVNSSSSSNHTSSDSSSWRGSRLNLVLTSLAQCRIPSTLLQYIEKE